DGMNLLIEGRAILKLVRRYTLHGKMSFCKGRILVLLTHFSSNPIPQCAATRTGLSLISRPCLRTSSLGQVINPTEKCHMTTIILSGNLKISRFLHDLFRESAGG